MIKFNKIVHPDGAVEFVAENIEELNAMAKAAENSNPLKLTDAQVQEAILNQQKWEAREYLKNTDWYASRLAETGTAIPDDVKTKRQQARDLLSS